MRPSDGARLALLGTIWGSSYLLIKIALEDLSPIQIVAARIVLGAAILIVLVRVMGLRLPHEAGVWRSLLLLSIVASIIPFLLISWGEERITSGLAAILNSSTPLFTAGIAAWVVPGERLRPLRVAGIGLGMAGVVTVVGFNGDGSEVLGELAVVASSVSYGIGFVFARTHLAHRGSPIALSAGQLMVASGAMLPLATLDGAADPPGFGLAAMASVAALGVVGTGLAYILYHRLIADVGPTSASFVTFLTPTVGVILGFVFLDERLGWNTLMGAVLVVAGIAVAERGARPTVPDEP